MLDGGSRFFVDFYFVGVWSGQWKSSGWGNVGIVIAVIADITVFVATYGVFTVITDSIIDNVTRVNDTALAALRIDGVSVSFNVGRC